MPIINNPELDRKIVLYQRKFHVFFDQQFTFNKSLWIAILTGSIFAFIGSDCYGGINHTSPIAVLISASLAFALIQVVLFIKLPVIRMVKFLTVLVTSFLLVKEAFALYSLNFLKFENACRPYLYTDTPIGYLWIIMPMVAIIGWCFAGNQESKLKEHLQRESEKPLSDKKLKSKPMFSTFKTKRIKSKS